MSDPSPTGYSDDQLVYVDPDARTVVGPVEWSKSGNPKPLPMKKDEEQGEKRRGGRKFYPWGTYKSMKRVFKLEGKQGKVQPDKTLDQVIVKALEQPFWD
ncbi:hypothetical protein HYZ99_00165 [Candidatus Peregrinibacteria bacterium]|nr:hypothetical protein [Candidatus Peregrinibacteria bacterium]